MKIMTLREWLASGTNLEEVTLNIGHPICHQSAPGALPNGTRIIKRNTRATDTHDDGSLGTILGSVGPLMEQFGYFVEFDDYPGVPVFIRGERVEVCNTEEPSGQS